MLHYTGFVQIESDNVGVYLHFVVRSADLSSPYIKHNISGMARVRLADLNGPKWASCNQNGPKWTILVHFGLANAKIQFGIRSF